MKIMTLMIFHLFYLKSSKIELQLLSLFKNKNESKRYCEAIELFDGAYALSRIKEHQWKHMMSCLKVANNETNNYRTWQSLFDFIELTISPIDKKPIRKLNKKSNVINKSSIFKKKVDCSNSVKLLNVRGARHRAKSKFVL